MWCEDGSKRSDWIQSDSCCTGCISYAEVTNAKYKLRGRKASGLDELNADLIKYGLFSRVLHV